MGNVLALCSSQLRRAAFALVAVAAACGGDAPDAASAALAPATTESALDASNVDYEELGTMLPAEAKVGVVSGTVSKGSDTFKLDDAKSKYTVVKKSTDTLEFKIAIQLKDFAISREYNLKLRKVDKKDKVLVTGAAPECKVLIDDWVVVRVTKMDDKVERANVSSTKDDSVKLPLKSDFSLLVVSTGLRTVFEYDDATIRAVMETPTK